MYQWIRQFTLSTMVFVTAPYTKVSIRYDRIIKCVYLIAVGMHINGYIASLAT